MALENIDPKGLIRDSYRIEGISASECRSIFLGWVLGVAAGADTQDQISQLLSHYGVKFPDHPMTRVLKEGQKKSVSGRRRGGRKGRLAH